ncbi:MAG: YgiT-type zinc finger protein [Eubacteriales bacterium]
MRQALHGHNVELQNVPCEACEQCGAKHYPDSVMEKLEQITSEAKSRMQELTVTDYSRVA